MRKNTSSHNRKIKIEVYNVKTGKVETFESIYCFINAYDYYKFDSTKLKKIRGGEIVKLDHFYICKATKSVTMIKARIKENEGILQNKIRKTALKNLKIKNDKLFNHSILILDKNFSIKEVHIGKAKDLANRKKIGYAGLKCKLSRFKSTIRNYYKGKNNYNLSNEHYCYIKDYI